MTEPTSDHAVRRFFGLVLVVVGALWIALAGVCAAGMLASTLIYGRFGIETLLSIAGALFIALVFGSAGYGIFIVGQKWWRTRD